VNSDYELTPKNLNSPTLIYSHLDKIYLVAIYIVHQNKIKNMKKIIYVLLSTLPFLAVMFFYPELIEYLGEERYAAGIVIASVTLFCAIVGKVMNWPMVEINIAISFLASAIAVAITGDIRFSLIVGCAVLVASYVLPHVPWSEIGTWLKKRFPIILGIVLVGSTIWWGGGIVWEWATSAISVRGILVIISIALLFFASRRGKILGAIIILAVYLLSVGVYGW